MAAVVVTVLATAGCGLEEDGAARETPGDEVPFGLLDPEEPALVPVPSGSPHTICLVGESELRPTSRRLDTDATLTDIVRSLAEEVTDEEAAQGLRSAVTSGVRVRSATVHRGSALVDFTSPPDLAGPDRVLAVAQIVCTLAFQPGIGQVSFTSAGAPLQIPIDDGSLTSEPVTLDDYPTFTDSRT